MDEPFICFTPNALLITIFLEAIVSFFSFIFVYDAQPQDNAAALRGDKEIINNHARGVYPFLTQYDNGSGGAWF